MKTRTNKLLLFVLIGTLLTSCETVDFGDTNTNPNESSIASSSGLLANALREIGTQVTQKTPMLYSQYVANGQYPDESRYVSLNWSYYRLYANPLNDLKTVIEINKTSTAPASINTLVAATLARVYFLHTMTDRWGRIPYTEALKGLELKKPVLDSQETVYKGLISEIDAVLAKITTSGVPQGDILFNGNMARWKQFGNTLKAVMALRLSKRDVELGGYAKTKFNEAISGAIQQSSDNIYYTFLSDDNNDNPWQDAFETRKDYLMSDVIVNYMIGTGSDTAPQDPRLAKYSDPATSASAGSGTRFIGADYGSGNDLVDNFSFITKDIIYNGTAPGIIFTAAQIQFSMAEAVELGWMTGNAETYFRNGIKESMKQWNVPTPDANTFADAFPYTGMQSIAEQKWVALFMQGYESWAEWRRIGGPSTIVKPAILLQGTDIPQRQAYATTTPNINKVNYDSAIAAQGPDNLDTKLWWAK
ncbi:SusD/RagB family nutrient-binding outer membrane lipoprotein [uncultured Tenacibaculum sp.]|uniref:SusD/RagB family nutrient-binding outer membrane lipoprotein n=1 Tax=uncultured Tenacibaculum sp. TaxID=174713 RepID=UPI00261E078D|nr:SusD/RagB family nutrient-binding outer membrane lipoprotein [uncultured Tenacibaculum sp.]